MEESSVLEKLRNVDEELRSLIDELSSKEEKAPTLEELRESFRRNLISDEDPTELIRKMRDREY